MQKTTFRIAKMDCPSEEQIIRMKLAALSGIVALDFDIGKRQLIVFHQDNYEQILQSLDSLNFDTSLIENLVASNSPLAYNNKREHKLLWQVLSINFFFFVLEILTGIVSKSMGLLADSLDMLADSIVYGLALMAVNGTMLRKRKIARWAGYFQLLLAILGFVEVVRRFLVHETLPDFQTMIVISLLALLGNGLSLFLLQKSKSKEAHMQASMIFTSNDVIVNIGVIVAGSLVYLTNSMYPDLVIGIIVFYLVARGAFKILKL